MSTLETKACLTAFKFSFQFQVAPLNMGIKLPPLPAGVTAETMLRRMGWDEEVLEDLVQTAVRGSRQGGC